MKRRRKPVFLLRTKKKEKTKISHREKKEPERREEKRREVKEEMYKRQVKGFKME